MPPIRSDTPPVWAAGRSRPLPRYRGNSTCGCRHRTAPPSDRQDRSTSTIQLIRTLDQRRRQEAVERFGQLQDGMKDTGNVILQSIGNGMQESHFGLRTTVENSNSSTAEKIEGLRLKIEEAIEALGRRLSGMHEKLLDVSSHVERGLPAESAVETGAQRAAGTDVDRITCDAEAARREAIRLSQSVAAHTEFLERLLSHIAGRHGVDDEQWTRLESEGQAVLSGGGSVESGSSQSTSNQ